MNKQPELIQEMKKRQKEFNVIVNNFDISDIASLTIEQGIQTLDYVTKSALIEQFAKDLMSEKVFSLVNIMMSRSTIDHMERLKRRVFAIIPQLSEHFAVLRKQLIDQFSNVPIDQSRLYALSEQYNNYDVYAKKYGAEVMQKLPLVYIKKMGIPEYRAIDKLGQDCRFSINGLLDRAYILEHKLADENPDRGITLATIKATATIIIGEKPDEMTRRFYAWNDDQVRLEKGISANIHRISAAVNSTPFPVEAILAEQSKLNRELQARRNGDIDTKKIQMSSGVSIIETMPCLTLQDLWRIKTIIAYKIGQERSGKKDVVTNVMRHKHFRANEIPLITVYERMLEKIPTETQ